MVVVMTMMMMVAVVRSSSEDNDDNHEVDGDNDSGDLRWLVMTFSSYHH